MLRKQVWHLLPGMVMCSFILLLGVEASPAYGEFLDYTYAPQVLHVDLDKNIIVVVFSGENPEYVIQQMDTGKRLWSIPYEDARVVFGNDAVAITRKGSIQVFDKATGRELWSESGEHLNERIYAYFIGDTQWIRADCDKSVIWYTPEGKQLKPVVPNVPEKNVWFAGWMEDGQTLLLTMYEETEDGVNTLTAYFWKPEDNHLEQGYVLTSSHRLSVWITPFDKKAIYAEYDTNSALIKRSFIDARSGELLKDLPVSNSEVFFSRICKNGLVVDTNEALNGYTVSDLETGKCIAAISEPEHVFLLHTKVTDKNSDWIVSFDKEHRLWLWPVEKDPKPRLIYTPPAGNYFPGIIQDIRFPYVFFDSKSQMEAYLLEDMVRVKSWRAEGTRNRVFTPDTCSNLNRVVAWESEGGRGSQERIWTTQVFEAFNPYPLCTVSGCPRGISPDGRYCAVQNPENGPVHIIEVDSSKTGAIVEKEIHESARVVFSPDNRAAVICFKSGRNTLVSLEEPYAQRTIKGGEGLVFSPDGNLYALSGTGEAKLYDLVTDRLIHTFVEPVKVQKRHEYPPDGFLETAERFGKNIIGTFVPGNKETPPVNCKFSEDGKQLITTASGQVLRVWDIKSGKIVRTIYTKLAEERNEKGYINNSWALSQNGSYAFAFNYDGFGASSLWDVNTGRMIAKDYLPQGEIKHVSVADDGSGVYMAIGGRIYFVAGKKK
jgi:WD40 repeat protein